jgi:hemerythrin-like domain-containing protein
MRHMMPIGPLMIEHRLIERMIAVISKELPEIETSGSIRPGFIETVVDFIRFYADRCHHGKEEDILFRNLQKKKIKDDHERIMKELIEEHKWGRTTTSALTEAYHRFIDGERESLHTILAKARNLVSFYPKHIEKEDKHFFRPVMDYFTREERDAMLEEGFEFDRKLIHEKYKKTVEEAEKRLGHIQNVS